MDLSRSQLESIGDGLATKLHRIKDVKLENNPLICDRCHMGSLIAMASSVSLIARSHAAHSFYFPNHRACFTRAHPPRTNPLFHLPARLSIYHIYKNTHQSRRIFFYSSFERFAAIKTGGNILHYRAPTTHISLTISFSRPPYKYTRTRCRFAHLLWRFHIKLNPGWHITNKDNEQ